MKERVNKKGISLIVLVITIIVMIILAAAVILTLNNNKIMNSANKAVNESNIKEVQSAASLAWMEAYTDTGIQRTDAAFQSAVENKLTASGVDISKYIVKATTKGVYVDVIPEAWKANIVDMADTVPIPKGFVASSATGENTKAGGLVIYEGSTPVTNENVATAKTTRNQYVWVPVDKDNFTTSFVRTAYTINGTTQSLSSTMGTQYWEVHLSAANMPLTTMAEQNSTYMSETTLVEVQKMYASVKKYGGFYIARYEMGIDSPRTSNTTDLTGVTNIHSMQNKYVYNYLEWSSSYSMNVDTGGAVEVSRSIYPDTVANTTGVVSTLTYGVQWDSALNFMSNIDNPNVSGAKYITNSKGMGNYKDTVIAAGTFNSGAQYAVYNGSGVGGYSNTTSSTAKAAASAWNDYSNILLLTTGAIDSFKVNNIYDMAGNVGEWTMEGYSTYYRTIRGGYFSHSGSVNPASYRNCDNPDVNYYDYGARPSLYIK